MDELDGDFFVFEYVSGIVLVLLEHLLVVGLVDGAHDLCLVGFDVMPDLLQEEDVVLQFLPSLLDAFDAAFLPPVQLFEVFLDA
jgi:hypothetical protein